MLIMIAAVAENGVIGDGSAIPWTIPSELRFFREQTLNHTIVFGRNTAKTLIGGLPLRKCLMLTTKPNDRLEGFIPADMYWVIRNSLKRDIFIGGGAEVYSLFLPHVDKIILSRITGEYQGDTHFPKINDTEFCLKEKQFKPEFTVEIYTRIK